jgi:rhamnosyltransferase
MVEKFYKKKLVSIIIRTKNEKKFILKTLNKIQRQKEKNFEIIIVDNQSTDGTVEEIKKKNFDNVLIKYYPFKIYKPGLALNYGAKFSSSKYLCFISAHCIPLNDMWLKNLISPLNGKKVVGVYGKQVPTNTTHIFEKKDLLYTFRDEKIVQTSSSFFHNANSVVKKFFWKKKRFNENTEHIEDIIWAKFWIKKKYKIIYEPKASVTHYHGMCHHNNEKKIKKILKVIKKCKL